MWLITLLVKLNQILHSTKKLSIEIWQIDLKLGSKYLNSISIEAEVIEARLSYYKTIIL